MPIPSREGVQHGRLRLAIRATSGFDGQGVVVVKGDRIVSAGPKVEVPARVVLDFPEAVLLLRLVDMHFLPRGVTTVLSQGNAGVR